MKKVYILAKDIDSKRKFEIKAKKNSAWKRPIFLGHPNIPVESLGGEDLSSWWNFGLTSPLRSLTSLLRPSTSPPRHTSSPPRHSTLPPGPSTPPKQPLTSPNLYLIMCLFWCEMSSKYIYILENWECDPYFIYWISLNVEVPSMSKLFFGGGGKNKLAPPPRSFGKKRSFRTFKEKNYVFLITVKYKYQKIQNSYKCYRSKWTYFANFFLKIHILHFQNIPYIFSFLKKNIFLLWTWGWPLPRLWLSP